MHEGGSSAKRLNYLQCCHQLVHSCAIERVLATSTYLFTSRSSVENYRLNEVRLEEQIVDIIDCLLDALPNKDIAS